MGESLQYKFMKAIEDAPETKNPLEVGFMAMRPSHWAPFVFT